MSLKCHFDSDGWLQGPISITHMTSPNHFPSGFADKARGLVQHTEDGFTAGTTATFMDPAAQVSAFFGVGEDGAAQQFLPVGHGFVAWAQEAGNPSWRSCECEDKVNPGSPMTQPQMVAFAQILEACSEYDGFPLAITDDPVNGHGLITHGAGGVNWGNHPDCPGDVRKAQRPQLVALAMSIRQEGTAVSTPARSWKTAGISSLMQLAKDQGTTPAVIIQLTAQRGPFAADVAAYLDGGDLSKVMAAGLVLWLPG